MGRLGEDAPAARALICDLFGAEPDESFHETSSGVGSNVRKWFFLERAEDGQTRGTHVDGE